MLICTEESNYYEYLKIADEKDSIFETYLNKNRTDEQAQVIISDAWKIVKDYTTEINNARKAELQKAVSNGRFLSDTNEIWQAIQRGRVQTIFIEQGKFQPAIWDNDTII